MNNQEIITLIRVCCEAKLSLAEIGEELDNAGLRPVGSNRLGPEQVRAVVRLLPQGIEYEVEKYWRPEQIRRLIAQHGIERENRRDVPQLSKRRTAAMDAVLETLQ